MLVEGNKCNVNWCRNGIWDFWRRRVINVMLIGVSMGYGISREGE